DPQRVPIGMGQRADLVFTMPRQGAVRLVDTEPTTHSSSVQAAIAKAGPASALPTVTIGDGPAPDVRAAAGLPLFDPTTYGAPAPDPVAAARTPGGATFPVVLAEAPGFHSGAIELVHTINGKASPAVPPITVREGETVRLHIVNDTAEYHPMHLHGHTMC